jgi:quercetin dioxygenase-like cupin family protein
MAAFPLPSGGTLRVVTADDHGLGQVVVTTSEHPPGGEVPVHKHPSGEIFVVTAGCGVFTVDGESIVGVRGDMVIVPPGQWHGFRAEGDEELRLVSAFDSGVMETTFPADSPLAQFSTISES